MSIVAGRLRDVPLFKGLSRKDLEMVAELAIIRHAREGQAIIKQGAIGNEFFVIADGSARVIRGKRTVARLKAGDFFGEMALLDRGPRNSTVIAESSMELIVLGRWSFMSLLGKMPEIAIKLLRESARRIRENEPLSIN
ncbi:MAG: cyclic nucleotide-binding domain-containing protein [Actinomycetota bacterium]|nr:cyclic nucleotide-binding domain-containing protein [Actinomycetota bacterium]